MSAVEGSLPKSLRILCFGDSLTAGYSRGGLQNDPYADHLRVRLQTMLSTSDVHVDVDGMAGDQVRGFYLKRLRLKLQAAAEHPYDWIIIMGGTNDLGWGQQPTEIYENLKKIWDLAMDTGARVLALNVIETAASSAGMVQKRNTLNDMIVHHADPRLFAFDLWSAIRYSTLDEEERELVWDDGVHLTREGYRKMGDAIAVHIFQILQSM